MKPWDLLTLVLAALQTNAALKSYATTRYGQAARVYDGYSGEFPPAPEECPYILVHSPVKSASREKPARQYELSVDYYTYDADDQERADDAAVSSGTEKLLALQELGKQAVLAGCPTGMISEITEEADTASLWPLLPATTTFYFMERVRVGQDALEQED